MKYPPKVTKNAHLLFVCFCRKKKSVKCCIEYLYNHIHERLSIVQSAQEAVKPNIIFRVVHLNLPHHYIIYISRCTSPMVYQRYTAHWCIIWKYVLCHPSNQNQKGADGSLFAVKLPRTKEHQRTQNSRLIWFQLPKVLLIFLATMDQWGRFCSAVSGHDVSKLMVGQQTKWNNANNRSSVPLPLPSKMQDRRLLRFVEMHKKCRPAEGRWGGQTLNLPATNFLSAVGRRAARQFYHTFNFFNHLILIKNQNAIHSIPLMSRLYNVFISLAHY